MEVLKIELEGVMTSFRYPHLLTGRQPSFPLPPPTTIYGHIASALGNYPPPDSFQFAYTFTHAGRVDDFEHTWLIKPDKRKQKRGKDPYNITLNMNPTVRELLSQPRLTLYLTRTDWFDSFRNPKFPVLLGRSQDLASYTRVEVVKLEERSSGYFDHCLLPFDPWRPRLGLGQGLLLPRFIDPQNRQKVIWARYVALTHHAFIPLHDEHGHDPQLIQGIPNNFRVWVDPTTKERKGRQRALEWLSIQGGGEALELSSS